MPPVGAGAGVGSGGWYAGSVTENTQGVTGGKNYFCKEKFKLAQKETNG